MAVVTDVDRIEALYRTRYGAFVATASAITGDRESAREVVQDAFAEALARNAQLREDDPAGWIWTVVVNRARDVRRRSHRFIPAFSRTPDSIVDSVDSDPDLGKALKRLPKRQREIVVLRYYADLSYEQIAALCGISSGAVAASLSKGLASLRRYLKEVATNE